jgi:acetaldehyde dehydrogenase
MKTQPAKVGCAIIGSGNIGTDLMFKIKLKSDVLECVVMVGIDAYSDGLRRARSLDIATTHEGIAGLLRMPEFSDIRIIFDATSAKAHVDHDNMLKTYADVTLVDLTPAGVGPYTVPVVNMGDQLRERNLNMVTCGGQATIPMVAAVSRVARVHYAEIIASISSRSAGPGTRANIDEFTETTARAIETVGRAGRGKAIIVLNPAEPPLLMRDTVFTLSDVVEETLVERSVEDMVRQVQAYVPGYRLKQQVQFERVGHDRSLTIPGYGEFKGMKTSIFLEVEGAADYLPAYAGNLDIMTSAALGTGERIAELKYLNEYVAESS